MKQGQIKSKDRVAKREGSLYSRKGSEIEVFDTDYSKWLSDLKYRYQTAQIKASVSVNSELIKFYWSLGRDISIMKMGSKKGDGYLEKISRDLTNELPDVKGFSVTNLGYIKRFYEFFSKSPQVVGEFEGTNPLCISLIPWGHIRYVLDYCKNDLDKALFYANKTIDNNWSRAVLLNFLDSDLYEREGRAVTNFSSSLPALQSDLAQQMTKDPYIFDFLSLTEKYDEKELKDALISNIEKFLLELGKGFAYMGREYRLEVGNEEKFIDMLFYNTNLHCYVVIEVKVDKFEASYLGQLGLYVSSVNHLLKADSDNPTIGLLICKTKDNVIAQYSLEGTSLPIGISEYELQKAYPKNFKSSLPSIKEIESHLGKKPNGENK